VLLLVVTIVALTTLPNVIADHDTLVFTQNSDPKEIHFRDVSNKDPQSSSVEVDISTILEGFFTVWVTDKDANLDLNGIDSVSLFANVEGRTSPILLSESGTNSGEFHGEVEISLFGSTLNVVQLLEGESMDIIYDPEPEPVGRFLAQLSGINDPGIVEVSDVIITNKAQVSCARTLVTHPVRLEFAGPPPDDIFVTLSYANGADIGRAGVLNLQMLYAPFVPGDVTFVFESLTPVLIPGPNALGGTLDLSGHSDFKDFPPTIGDDRQITNVLQPPSPEGMYAIGYKDNGCSGGGGGGVAKAGFVVQTVAGIGAIQGLAGFFGSGSINGGLAPTITGSFFSSGPDPSFTLLGGAVSSGGVISLKNIEDSSEPIPIQTNNPIQLTFNMRENQGINNIEHLTAYFYTGDPTGMSMAEIISKTDTKVLFDTGQSVHVTDPHGYFANAEFDLLEIDAWNMKITYDITFAKPMDTTSILIRSWDRDRNQADKLLVNAIKVVETSFQDVPTDITSEESSITETQSVDIPLWVKNNANWWYQKQIDDSDFVSGIEYMISENIINVPQTEVSDSGSSEIPDWLRDVAGFWANDSISDAEFVQSIQWMIINGVLVVV